MPGPVKRMNMFEKQKKKKTSDHQLFGWIMSNPKYYDILILISLACPRNNLTQITNNNLLFFVCIIFIFHTFFANLFTPPPKQQKSQHKIKKPQFLNPQCSPHHWVTLVKLAAWLSRFSSNETFICTLRTCREKRQGAFVRVLMYGSLRGGKNIPWKSNRFSTIF